MTSSVPIIDLSLWRGGPKERTLLANHMRETCHNIGFFYLVNHGLEKSVCQDHLEITRTFFDLELKEKKQIHKSSSRHFRGWEPICSELTNNEPDYREQYDFSADLEPLENPNPVYMNLIGPNQWPAEEKFPGFKKAILKYLEEMQTLAREVLGLFSVSLKLDEKHLENVFGRRPMPYAKLTCYPPTPKGASGVGLHKDSAFLTLLLQDPLGGLQILNQNKELIDVPPIEGSFVVNIGEMMQIMTGNYYIATPHRVVNKNPGKKRFSAPFFYEPDFNMPLKPLPLDPEFLKATEDSPSHSKAGFMPLKRDIGKADVTTGQIGVEKYGDRFWDLWVRSHPEIAEKFYPEYV